MKKRCLFHLLLYTVFLWSCGTAQENKEEKTTESVAKPPAPENECPPWVGEFSQLAKEMRALADEYDVSGKIDQKKMDAYYEKGSKFEKDGEEMVKDGWAGYPEGCGQEYVNAVSGTKTAFKVYQHAAEKHMSK